MRVPAAALALVFVLLLAGCSLPVDPGAVDPSLGPGTPTPAPTPTVDPANPWPEVELEAAIRVSSGDDREYGPLVRRALDFWTGEVERHAGYPVSFRVIGNADDADLVVSFVDRVRPART